MAVRRLGNKFATSFFMNAKKGLDIHAKVAQLRAIGGPFVGVAIRTLAILDAICNPLAAVFEIEACVSVYSAQECTIDHPAAVRTFA